MEKDRITGEKPDKAVMITACCEDPAAIRTMAQMISGIDCCGTISYDETSVSASECRKDTVAEETCARSPGYIEIPRIIS